MVSLRLPGHRIHIQDKAPANGLIGECTASGSSTTVLIDEVTHALPDIPLFHNHPDGHVQAMSMLQLLYHQSPNNSNNSIGLQKIRRRALDNRNRSDRLTIGGMEFVFLLQQICILLLLLTFTFAIDDFDVVWQCPGLTNWSIVTWVGYICLAIGIARPFVDSSFVQPREILHISSLPPSIIVGTCEDCCLAMVPPPGRRTGILCRIISYFQRHFTLFRMRKYTSLSQLSINDN